MGHTLRDWEMLQIKGEFREKFTLEGKDDSHNLLSNMVDVRACYKPSEKVSEKRISYIRMQKKRISFFYIATFLNVTFL